MPKSNVLLLGHPTKINNIDFILQYNGSTITLCNSTKVLGLVIDKNFFWNDHLQLLLNKLSPNPGLLRRLSFSLPNNILFLPLFLYYSATP